MCLPLCLSGAQLCQRGHRTKGKAALRPRMHFYEQFFLFKDSSSPHTNCSHLTPKTTCWPRTGTAVAWWALPLNRQAAEGAKVVQGVLEPLQCPAVLRVFLSVSSTLLFFELGSHAAQAGLELSGTSNPPTSADRVGETTGTHHRAWPLWL